MKISLNGTWQLRFHPSCAQGPLLPQEADRRGWTCIPATVPGNVELDLMAAGLEEDPFYGQNLYRFHKYEYYDWIYSTTFAAPQGKGPWKLHFEGVNTIATYFLNGEQVGHTENMLIEHDIPVTLQEGENRLDIYIASAMNRARQEDFPVLLTGESTEYTRLRMPPSSFGWDIMPRLLSAGLWRGVSLEEAPATRILETYYTTLSATEKQASLLWKVRFTTDAECVDDFTVRISGQCGTSSFCQEKALFFTAGEGKITLDRPMLWWPRGYGEANLYEVTLELLHHGQVVDCRREKIGLRMFRLEHSLEEKNAGEFRIWCNGWPIMAKGSNWVPLDALHSRDASRYEQALDLFRDMGCNILRCWGGNVYEDHAFFDLCDRYGIMVWQDFSMACGIYPQEEAFYAVMREEATAVVKKLRNHASILLWAGDNEVDAAYRWNGYILDTNRHNAVTREVLPNVVRMHDPARLFLPSSPFIPEGSDGTQVPEQHNWGPRSYFKDDFYKQNNAHFISETGYHGCPSPASLKKYIPQDQLWPRLNSDVWDTHNTDYVMTGRRGYNRIGLMTDQVDILFGSVPEELDRFAMLSQIVQAEAKKYFVERVRIKKGRINGIIWWNMLDGWPQISDAIVDWYWDKKEAYAVLKRVHVPICVMMDEQDAWGSRVVLSNDSRTTANVEYQVEDENGTVLLKGETTSKANENEELGQIRLLPGQQRLFVIRWKTEGKAYANHFISGMPPFNPDQMLKWYEIIRQLP